MSDNKRILVEKKYIPPVATVVSVLLQYTVLCGSSGHSVDTASCSMCIPETTCPFNGKLCVNKQNRLDAWRQSVECMAKHHINHAFFTTASMFDGCPEGFAELCPDSNQRQH